ncbi:FecCD family ABC transporter permease [Nocardia sp. NBC_00416]|uniref:FecCD family ABC transporter permease n=1 Tax=Nocardia sp. NBC_00416 TaxID=2975991 RepID=UPI002E239BCC
MTVLSRRRSAESAAILPGAVRVGRLSFVRRPAVILVVALLAVALCTLFCVDIATGSTALPLGRVLDVLGGGGTRSQRFIVLDSRLPRALTGVVVGMALGIAGALTQSVLHNPLAAPDVLGITSGAGLGAVTVLAGSGGAATGLAAAVGAPLAAVLGGLGTAGLIYFLAWGRRRSGDVGTTGIRLVLIGIGVNSLLLAGINWTLVRSDFAGAARAQRWLTGSLDDATGATLAPAAVALALVVAVALISARTLAALRLGTDSTRMLGVRLRSQQALLIGAAVVAVSVATAAVGPIAFVGLVAPQVARRLLRSPGEPLIGSALTGGILVLGADILARVLLPVDLPVGIVTAALGGPFLLYLLVLINRKATL